MKSEWKWTWREMEMDMEINAKICKEMERNENGIRRTWKEMEMYRNKKKWKQRKKWNWKQIEKYRHIRTSTEDQPLQA